MQVSSHRHLLLALIFAASTAASAQTLPPAPGTGGTTTGSPNTGAQAPGTRTNAGTTTSPTTPGSTSAGPSGGAYTPTTIPAGAGETTPIPAPNMPYAGSTPAPMNPNDPNVDLANVSARVGVSTIITNTPRRVVSLREALQLTATQGPDVAAARAQASIVEAGVRRAWTAWQPDLNASGIIDHTNAPQFFDLNLIGGAFHVPTPGGPIAYEPLALINPAAGSRVPIVAVDSHYGTLQITQPLLTPQGLFAPSIANHGAEAARRGADEATEQILLSTAQAYFALQGIDGLLNAAHDLETVALHREDEANAQIKAGTAVELQLLRAENDTAEARLQIANLEGQRESLLPLLEALAGEAIAPMPAGSPNTLPAPGQFNDEPWENAFSVRSAIEGVRTQEAAIRLDDWLWLPQVAASLKGNYTSNLAFTGKNWSYDAILTANIPLYDHGARYASLHEDQARLRQAVAQLAGTRAKARATWIGARANLAAAQAALSQAQSQSSVATRAQTQVEASFKAGVSTSLDLTDADNKRFTATSAAAQARTVVDLRKAQLAAAEGHLASSMLSDK